MLVTLSLVGILRTTEKLNKLKQNYRKKILMT